MRTFACPSICRPPDVSAREQRLRVRSAVRSSRCTGGARCVRAQRAGGQEADRARAPNSSNLERNSRSLRFRAWRLVSPPWLCNDRWLDMSHRLGENGWHDARLLRAVLRTGSCAAASSWMEKGRPEGRRREGEVCNEKRKNENKPALVRAESPCRRPSQSFSRAGTALSLR